MITDDYNQGKIELPCYNRALHATQQANLLDAQSLFGDMGTLRTSSATSSGLNDSIGLSGELMRHIHFGRSGERKGSPSPLLHTAGIRVRSHILSNIEITRRYITLSCSPDRSRELKNYSASCV